jgi:SAM-dependent methyltransferase
VQRTADGFGFEWREFHDTIQDTYMTGKHNFLDFIHPITESFFAEKIVLDAGCGMGRFLRLGAEFGSREIIGVDLSEAVDVAYRNVRHLPNAHVVQGDILMPPLRPDFDYVFSIGVLQFLPDPQQGFDSLAGLLRPRGRLSVWVYSAENNNWITRLVSPVRTRVTSRLPRRLLYWISQVLGTLVHLVAHLIYKPANESRFALGRLLPYNDYLYYNSRLTRGSMVSIVFDHLVPPRVTYLGREQLRACFEAAGLADVEIDSRNRMSWRAHGTRLAD